MKIAICTAGTRSLIWFRMDMMKSFQDLGWEVVAVGNEPEADWTPFFEKKNIRYRSFYVERNGINPVNDIRTFLDLKRVFLEEKPDKVFVYHAKANIYGALAAKAAGISDIYAMVGGLGSAFASSGVKAKVLRSILTAEYRHAFRATKKVFFQNCQDVDIFLKRKILPENKVAQINGSGVNVDQFKYSKPPNTPSFIYIGRLICDKGIREYLEAARKLKNQYPDAEFHVVGSVDSNPSSISLADLAQYIDDESIVYHGFQEDVRPFLEKTSVFVLPSYREGTPKAALEAMAIGRPVILANSPGCQDVVEHGRNGLLVNVADISSLVEGMTEFIHTPSLIEQMGSEGCSIVGEKYDVRIINKVINSVVFEDE